MKRVLGLIAIAAISFLVESTPLSLASATENRDQLLREETIDGVQLSLASLDSNGLKLEVAFRNVSDHDVSLNMGHMLGNGRVQLPDYVSLSFTDAQGKERLFQFADKKHSFVAGRLDDYVVPLRAGSIYTVTLSLDQFWCQETKEFEIPLLPGQNRLTAQFEGHGAQAVNLDMPGIKLMNFWLGKVASNTLVIERRN